VAAAWAVASEENRKAGGGEVLVVGEGFGQAEAAHDGEGDAVDDAGAIGWVSRNTSLTAGARYGASLYAEIRG
jgi:hypothetical protein